VANWEIRNGPNMDETGVRLHVVFGGRDWLFCSDQPSMLYEEANGEIVMHWEYRAGYWLADGVGQKQKVQVNDSMGIFLSQVYERMRPYVETYLLKKDAPAAPVS
jgi:hypothetical protein